MRKILSLTLALVMVCSLLVMPTFATTDYSNGTQVEYDASQDENNPGEAYTITVPAKLAPGQTGTVTLEGTWASNKTVKVWSDETVTLTNSINAADQKILDVTFAGIEEAGNDTASQTFTEAVSVADIENALFGTWSGKFNYNVEMNEILDLNPDNGTTPIDGEVYTAGDYKYTYNTSDGGWRVAINTDVTDKNQTSYGEILESINGVPITNMATTFYDCTNLTIAPEIPTGVKNMSGTFYECTALKIAPEIPAGVTDMNATFEGCSNLTTAPTIPASVRNMSGTFAFCIRLITVPNIPTGVTNMSNTFYNCIVLKTVPKKMPAGVADMSGTFHGCAHLVDEISIPCSLASKNYTYNNSTVRITYYHVNGCKGSCGQ